ncbi:MAG: glucose 1-dehydrogenase [Pseudomonadota bacterium]
MLESLQGKVAIVTGSSSGIGEACAVEMARRGGRVAINYATNETGAQRTAEKVRALGAEAIIVQADVTVLDSCQMLVDATLSEWGQLDVLINNAGRTKFNAHDDLDGLDKSDFLEIYETNLVGAYQLIQAAYPSFKSYYEERGAVGTIVNMASIAGVAGIGSSVAYAASKGALNTMTKSLARALAPAVRVNAICPGWVGTPWMGKQFGEEGMQRMANHFRSITPLDHAGVAEDVALATLFFACDLSRHVTGETLLVDGGYHLALK